MKDFSLREIWRRVRLGGELRPMVCLAASAAAAAILVGIGMTVAYGVGLARPDRTGSMIVGDVRDADITLGAAIAGGVWLVTLIWLWRPAVRLRRHSRGATRTERLGTPLLISAAIAIGATLIAYVVGNQRWDDSKYLSAALWLIAGGAVVIAWLPAIFDLERGKPIVGPDGRVNVHCPDCGYEMAGLHSAGCPECGRKFTLDALIRAQDYEGLRSGGDSE